MGKIGKIIAVFLAALLLGSPALADSVSVSPYVLLSQANTWTQTQTITPAANTQALIVSGYSVTGSGTTPMLDLSGTWNTSGNPTAIKLNMTNTGSTGANLLDLQVGGASEFKVSSTGNISGPGYVITSSGSTFVGVVTANGASGQFSIDGDVNLFRDGAGIFADRNGANAQKSRWYNSFTDASNGSWAEVDTTTANTAIFATNGNGTGVATMSKMQFNVLGTNRLDYGVTTAATWSTSSAFSAAGLTSLNTITAGASSSISWLGRSKLASVADGEVGVFNQAGNGFTLFQFGGTDNLHPALAVSSATLQVKLADNSGFAGFANSFETVGGAGATLSSGELAGLKITASGVAPGAGYAKMEWVAGTAGGSCKLIAYAGTSTTPVVVVDNVGAGC